MTRNAIVKYNTGRPTLGVSYFFKLYFKKEVGKETMNITIEKHIIMEIFMMSLDTGLLCAQINLLNLKLLKFECSFFILFLRFPVFRLSTSNLPAESSFRIPIWVLGGSATYKKTSVEYRR